jgi:hypothetical protein
MKWVREVVYEKYHAVGEQDIDLVHIFDSADDAFAYLEKLDGVDA